jgi:hypothetical protein
VGTEDPRNTSYRGVRETGPRLWIPGCTHGFTALSYRRLPSRLPVGVSVSSPDRSWTLRSRSSDDAGTAPRGCRTIRTTWHMPPHRHRLPRDALERARASLSAPQLWQTMCAITGLRCPLRAVDIPVRGRACATRAEKRRNLRCAPLSAGRAGRTAPRTPPPTTDVGPRSARSASATGCPPRLLPRRRRGSGRAVGAWS